MLILHAPSRIITPCVSGLLSVIATLTIVPAASAAEIGVAAAVGPIVQTQPPNETLRQLFIGNRLVHNESLETSDRGRTQVLFLDGSALTVGPGAKIVLDEFVYDPESKTGRLAMTAARGLFRYVGGKISKKTPVKFRTPTATIGIRGGITIINVQPNLGPQIDTGGIGQQAAQQQAADGGQAPAGGAAPGAAPAPGGGPGSGGTTATFVFGEQMTVSSGGETRTVDRPGFQVTATSANAPPSPATQAAPASLAASLDNLEASPGGNEAGGSEGGGQDVAQNQGGGQNNEGQQGDSQQQNEQQQAENEQQNENEQQQAQNEQQGGDQGQGDSQAQGGGQQQAGASGQGQQATGNQSLNTGGQPGQQTALAGQGGAGRTPVVNQQVIGDQFAGGPPTAGINPGFNPSLPGGGPPPPTGFNPNDDPNTQAPDQQTALEGVAALPQFPGRYKTSPDAGTARGTGDVLAQFNRPFSNAVIDNNNRLRANLGGNFLDLPAPQPGKTISFAAGGTDTPFGPVSGTVTARADGSFNFYQLNELQRTGARALLFFGVGTPLNKVPTVGVDEFDLKPDFITGSNIPLIPADLGGSIGFTGTAGTVGDGGVLWQLGTGSLAQRPLAFGDVHVLGSGSTQKSAIGGFIGHLTLVGQNNPAIDGHVRGSSNLGDGNTYFFHGAVGSTPDGNRFHLFGKTRPENFVLQGSTLNPDGTTSPSAVIADGIDGSTTTYFPNAIAERDSTPETDQNETRTGGTLTGFVAGALTQAESNGTISDVRQINSQSALDGITIVKSAVNNKLATTIKYHSAGSGTDDTTILLGGDGDGRSFFAFDDAFGAVETGDTTATVDGDTVSRLRAYMQQTPGLSNTSSGFIPSGVTFCQCQALQWGFWGSDILFASGTRDRVHLANWVAGTAANAADIVGLTGSATYNGHVIGTVITGSGAASRSYLAVGNYSQTYNFATSTGTVNINSFDGTNYTGTVSRVSAGQAHRFTGNVTATGIPTRTGQLGGAFFVGGTDNAKHVGGQIGINDSGSDYAAAGIFAADRN